MTHSPAPVPAWLIERLALGDLPADRVAVLRERLAAEGRLGELERLAQSDAELLQRYPAADVLAEVRRRSSRAASQASEIRRERPQRGIRVAALGLGLVCAALAFWATDWKGDLSEQPREHIAARGLQPHLIAYRKSASGIERLGDRAQVRAHDQLQLTYVAAGRKYGVVASIDSRAAITLHLPERPGRAVSLDDSGEIALPHAFELDDTEGDERFWFVTADEPFSTQLVTDALRDGKRPAATSSELVLQKAPR